MSTKKNTFARKALASVGAAALGLMGVIGLSATAMADEVADPETPVLGAGNINPQTPGSLTIHKYSGGGTDQNANGGPLDPSPDRRPLKGVTFQICEVTAIDNTPVNLGKPESWDALSALIKTTFWTGDKGNPTPVGFTPSEDCAEATTLADGSVKTPLSVGLYFVWESDKGDNPISTMSDPFLVTIPYNTDNEWNYNVHVYPKNTVDDNVTKEVNDAGAYVEGDSVTWTVKSGALGSAPTAKFTSYVMTDTLDSRLTYETGTLVVTLVDGDERTPLSGGTVAYPADGTANTLSWTAGGENLVLINAASSTAYVEFEFDTTVNGAGAIDNTALVNGTESTTATTNWGLAQLIKKDEDNNKLLSGAEFSLYRATKNEDGAFVCPPNPEGEPLLTGLETNDQGVIETVALKVGSYCFKETKAPAGYELPTGNAAWSKVVEVTAGERVSGSVEMTNTKQPPVTLPPTGANGTILMTVGGIALVAVAGGLYMVTRRKADQK